MEYDLGMVVDVVMNGRKPLLSDVMTKTAGKMISEFVRGTSRTVGTWISCVGISM